MFLGFGSFIMTAFSLTPVFPDTLSVCASAHVKCFFLCSFRNSSNRSQWFAVSCFLWFFTSSNSGNVPSSFLEEGTFNMSTNDSRSSRTLLASCFFPRLCCEQTSFPSNFSAEAVRQVGAKGHLQDQQLCTVCTQNFIIFWNGDDENCPYWHIGRIKWCNASIQCIYRMQMYRLLDCPMSNLSLSVLPCKNRYLCPGNSCG